MKKSIIGVIVIVISICAYVFTRNNGNGKEVQELTLLLDWKMESFYSPYVLADVKGFYEAEGIKINIIEGQGAETSAKLIGKGEYKIGTCNAAATATAIEANIPITSIAMVEQDAVTAIFSLDELNIKVPRDLYGKKLGVRHYDISHKEYLAMMQANSLEPEKVQEISVGWELQPLLTKQIDALYNYAYNMPIVLESQGYKVNRILVKDFGVIGYGSNIIANNDFIKNNQDIIKAFLRASKKGWEAAIANPEEAIAILKQKYVETNEKIALATFQEQLKWISTSQKVEIFSQSESKWKEVLSGYESVGIIQSTIPARSVFTHISLE